MGIAITSHCASFRIYLNYKGTLNDIAIEHFVQQIEAVRRAYIAYG